MAPTPWLALLGLLLSSGVARGSTLTVPDDLPTVQAAIDAGADTVEVRDGIYLDSIQVHRSLDIRAAPRLSGHPPDAFPTLGPISFVAPSVPGCRFEVSGVRVAGALRAVRESGTRDAVSVRVTETRLDSGASIKLSDHSQVSIRGCLVHGTVDAGLSENLDFTENTVVGGALRAYVDRGSAIRGNLFLGPAEVAIEVGGGPVWVSDNTITGVRNGIVVWVRDTGWGGVVVESNTVEDCDESGVVVSAGDFDTPSVRHNVIRRCGDYGIIVRREATISQVDSNLVEDVGRDGILVDTDPSEFDPSRAIRGNSVARVGGFGIRVSAWALQVEGNHVVRADSTGLFVGLGERLAGNVVGRCGGDGVVIEDAADHTACLSNTVYSNGGDGFRVGSVGQVYGPGDSVSLNIAYANGGHGLTWPEGAPAPVLSCNDWYGNEGGATAGVAVGASDLGLAPLFCDVAHDEVTLAVDSPLLAAAGCGLIGAQGQGCGVRTGTPGAEGAAVAFAAWPRPARAGVTFAWAPSAGPVRVEVYDALGARRAVLEAEAGSSGMKWDGCGRDGARLAPGVYFARLSRLEGSGVTRVVLVQ